MLNLRCLHKPTKQTLFFYDAIGRFIFTLDLKYEKPKAMKMYNENMNLIYNIWKIQPLFTCSKWNMGDICGLKFHLPIISKHMHKIMFFWNPTVRNAGHFYYRICNFGHIYQLRKSAWRNFTIFFTIPLFTFIFRPIMLIVGTYSNLSK